MIGRDAAPRRGGDLFGEPLGAAARRRIDDPRPRIGGDEFVVFGLLTGNDTSHAAKALREQIFDSTRGNFDIADTVLQYQGASVGLVVAAPGEKMSDILKRADTEMYLQKKQRSTRR